MDVYVLTYHNFRKEEAHVVAVYATADAAKNFPRAGDNSDIEWREILHLDRFVANGHPGMWQIDKHKVEQE